MTKRFVVFLIVFVAGSIIVGAIDTALGFTYPLGFPSTYIHKIAYVSLGAALMLAAFNLEKSNSDK